MSRTDERADAPPVPGSSGRDRAPSTRRARARRFSCPHDPVWHRWSGGLAALCAAVSLLGAAAHLVDLPWALLIATIVGVPLALRLMRRAPPAPGVLRWDGAAWWWQARDAHGRAGAPLAVCPQVIVDLERWMLLRLAPELDEHGLVAWREWSVRRACFLAVSRRSVGADWSMLRIHLWLAKA